MSWLFHLLVALISIPLYINFGDVFKVAIAPYVLYLVFTKRADYLILLLFHFMFGSTVSFFILFGTLVFTLVHLKSLWEFKFNRVLLVFSCLLILLHGYNVEEQLRVGNNFVEILSSVAYPLSVFPFFWGQKLRGNLDADFLKKFFTVGILFVLMQFVLGESLTIRYIFFFVPFFLLSGILSFKRFNTQLNSFDLLIVFGFLVVGLVLGFIKGTIIFIVAFALLITFSGRVQLIKELITKPRVLIVLVSLFIFSINQVNSANLSLKKDWGENSPFESLENFFDYAKFKTIGDRATLWLGGLNYLKGEATLLPPIKYPEIRFNNIDGAEISEVSFGIHNLPLELMRSGGWISGLTVTFIFLRITFLIGRRINIHKANKSDKVSQAYLALIVILFSSALVGGMVGQYLLNPSFSLLFMGLIGLIQKESIKG